MITLRFFQDEPRGVVLDLLYALDLFIGYTCESSIAVVQPWRDHRRNKLFYGTVRKERTDRGESPECKRLLMCCFIDSVWSRCTPRFVTVVWKGMQLPPISADSQPTELIRTDELTSIISFFFCVKLQFVALHPWQSVAYTGLNVGLSRSEIARWCTVRDFCVISVLVIVTAVTCYDIRQGLWIQGE